MSKRGFTAVSDAQGFLRFRKLTAGVYTLTETEAPDGYKKQTTPITVTISQHPITREYHIVFEGEYQGSGTADDPFCIANYGGYRLPETGGRGVIMVYTLGAALVILSLVLLARKKRSI